MSLPTPYYDEDGITIYHGDCRDILPHLPKVDLVLTDPPYELSDSPPSKNHYGMGLRKFEGQSYTSLTVGFDVAETFCQLSECMDKFNLFCFCSNKQISEIMAWGRAREFATTMLIWHKPNAVPFANGVWRGDAEFCIHIRESRATFNGNAEQKRKVVSIPCVLGEDHPTVKPLALIARYVAIGSNDGDTIIDPFMGSGTTLRAAKDLGRKCIGIEIEEKYCEIAARRLAQEVLAL